MTDSLAALKSRVARCRLCAKRFAGTATAHAPRPVLRGARSARILIASQAPGVRAHASGLPFDDPSGVRLRDWMGLDAPTFYDAERIAIVPMAFCFPGYDARDSDLPPPAVCAATWRARVLAALPKVELTLMIGGHAQRWHLGPGARVTDSVRAWRAHLPGRLALPHPSWRNSAWLKRNPWFEEEVLPWLRGEVRRLVA
ncbi:MAG TPA: uracil-DNA glycosylase family protein [Thermohalobaculum sp.]|nr:uracil-DNA glycosylase family protein [Thermohalobaculum sp.]